MALVHSPCKLPMSCPKLENLRTTFKPFSFNIPTKPKFGISRTSTSDRFNKTAIRGVKCCLSSRSSPQMDKGTSSSSIIFIKGSRLSTCTGLAQSTTEGGLKGAFSHFGEVSRVKIVHNKQTKQSLGFAYVWFTREEDAVAAVEDMNGKFLEGRFVHVTIARPGSCKLRSRSAPYKF